MLARQQPALTLEELTRLQQQVAEVHAAPAIIEYLHAILQFTRGSERFLHGLSPRAGLAILRAAKAWALLAERDYVIPEDIQAVLPVCVAHRLVASEHGGRLDEQAVAAAILDHVAIV